MSSGKSATKMVAGEPAKTTAVEGTGAAEVAVPAPVRVRVNPVLVKGPGKVVVAGARDEGGDLVVEHGGTALLSAAEYARVKDLRDGSGLHYLVKH